MKPAIVELLSELIDVAKIVQTIIATEDASARLPVLQLCRTAIDVHHAVCVLRQHAEQLNGRQEAKQSILSQMVGFRDSGRGPCPWRGDISVVSELW
jgi:hypothetical protein